MSKYSIEDKKKYIELIKTGKHSIRSAAKELGISKSVGERWLKIHESLGVEGLITDSIKPGKNYSFEFKLNGVKYKQENHLSLNQASIDLRISSGSLARWEKIYLEEGDVGFMPKVRNLQPKVMKNKESKLSSSTEKGNHELIYENDKLKAEIAYLKKCIALAQAKTKSETKKRLQ